MSVSMSRPAVCVRGYSTVTRKSRIPPAQYSCKSASGARCIIPCLESIRLERVGHAAPAAGGSPAFLVVLPTRAGRGRHADPPATFHPPPRPAPCQAGASPSTPADPAGRPAKNRRHLTAATSPPSRRRRRRRHRAAPHRTPRRIEPPRAVTRRARSPPRADCS